MIEQLGRHFNYDWEIWAEGKLRTIIDPHVDEDMIQVVAIITAEHQRLRTSVALLIRFNR